MKRGFYVIMSAQFFSSLADNAIFIAAIALLRSDGAPDWQTAALVPIFGAFGVHPYRLVDGVAIASDGPVYSVFLAHRGPLAEVRSVVLDPASLTSVHLLQVLLAEFHGLRPRCLTVETGESGQARLLIGNQAIAFRAEAEAGWNFLDLAFERGSGDDRRQVDVQLNGPYLALVLRL